MMAAFGGTAVLADIRMPVALLGASRMSYPTLVRFPGRIPSG